MTGANNLLASAVSSQQNQARGSSRTVLETIDHSNAKKHMCTSRLSICHGAVPPKLSLNDEHARTLGSKTTRDYIHCMHTQGHTPGQRHKRTLTQRETRIQHTHTCVDAVRAPDRHGNTVTSLQNPEALMATPSPQKPKRSTSKHPNLFCYWTQVIQT